MKLSKGPHGEVSVVSPRFTAMGDSGFVDCDALNDESLSSADGIRLVFTTFTTAAYSPTSFATYIP